MTQLASLVLLGYLPGALLFRLPLADRPRRASLPADERAFWAVVLSVCVSSVAGLLLALSDIYTFERVLWFDASVCGVCVLAGRSRLRLGREAGRLQWPVLAPVALVAVGLWLYFPSSEYLMGGKDPGTYMNEGIQIAQRGGVVTHDTLIASVPRPARDLFFPSKGERGYHGVRFMGFFILNPATGDVIGQFPHLYPVWIAIGYGVHGLTGARQAVGVWAILGLLAVYFAAARLVGRLAASVGCGLLAIHVAQVWFARYPNSEVVAQALVFAALLAYSRAHEDRDRFFAPVAGLLCGLLPFARIDALLVIVAVALAEWLAWLRGRPPLAAFVLPAVGGVALAVAYLLITMTHYSTGPIGILQNLQPPHLAALAMAGAGAGWLTIEARRRSMDRALEKWTPNVVIVVVLAAAAYAYFVRTAGGRTAPHDADALRTYAAFYLTPYGLAAALLGFVLIVRRAFWRSPALLLTATSFALFVFYKVRIVPEHFWLARRLLPVILPMSLVLIAAAACAGFDRPGGSGGRQWVRRGLSAAIGLAFVLMLGQQFASATRAIENHIEYAGLIPRLEELAGRFGDRDLVIVEARNASDLHVLALPLAYTYARNVLVLDSPRPDKATFRGFLTWARARYREVFFMGGGGTDLLSRSIGVTAVGSERFQVPEYESLYNAYPRNVRQKEWDFGIYQFVTPRGGSSWFSLDVGTADDLHVVHFHAKERHQGETTFRWSRDVSYVSILVGEPDASLLTLWMSDGGRPAQAGPTQVKVTLDDQSLGQVTVETAFRPYTFALPPDLAPILAAREQPALLELTTTTWNPRTLLGASDDRDVGVMVDRIELK